LGVADIAFEAARIIVEIDGQAWHFRPGHFQRDRTRRNDLVNAGWTVLRFTWADLTERADYVLDCITEALLHSTLGRS